MTYVEPTSLENHPFVVIGAGGVPGSRRDYQGCVRSSRRRSSPWASRTRSCPTTASSTNSSSHTAREMAAQVTNRTCLVSTHYCVPVRSKCGFSPFGPIPIRFPLPTILLLFHYLSSTLIFDADANPILCSPVKVTPNPSTSAAVVALPLRELPKHASPLWGCSPGRYGDAGRLL
ncbi:hypothetical protein FIBSPDRAFT_960711 [Athelia psychrophila]|uniref:Uncharacterized protein n=1 Tax=Athelia psychrophila TaxID=1759441 RepID=A0A166C518_9AGAM|nr:hypothetical protein FIBSPDRAFT_960711 [Fibularhizoctonia sp. CBS 109695]